MLGRFLSVLEELTSVTVRSSIITSQSLLLMSGRSCRRLTSYLADSKTGKTGLSLSESFLSEYYRDGAASVSGFFLFLGIGSSSTVEGCSFIRGIGSSGSAIFVDTFVNFTMRSSRV